MTGETPENKGVLKMDWDNFGYETDEPCEVCGKIGKNKAEPRFYYVVCEEHSKLTPVEVSMERDKRDATKLFSKSVQSFTKKKIDRHR